MSAKVSRLSVTEIRARLCTLLNGRQRSEGVEITKRGRTIGLLLVGPTAVTRGKALLAGPNQSSRRTLQGTVEIHRDIDAGLRKVRAQLWQRRRG
jgi:antitoxin (DNA-binding transcriptional repressor) of toxin-antitoxin stability system